MSLRSMRRRAGALAVVLITVIMAGCSSDRPQRAARAIAPTRTQAEFPDSSTSDPEPACACASESAGDPVAGLPETDAVDVAALEATLRAESGDDVAGLEDWETSMLGAAATPAAAPQADPPPAATSRRERAVPRLIVYDFTSSFDDNALGATVGDVLTGHAKCSGRFETFSELEQDERMGARNLGAAFDGDVDLIVRHAREVFAADIAVWGSVSGTRDEPTLHVLAADLRGERESILLRDAYPCPNIHYIPMAAERILAACLRMAFVEPVAPKTLGTLSGNLLANGSFDRGGAGWESTLPTGAAVADGVLRFELTEAVAVSCGLGMMSEYARVEPGAHYECSVRVRSPRSSVIVWVKGYAEFAAHSDGERAVDARREVYNHQMRPLTKVEPDAHGWHHATSAPFRPRHFRHEITWMRVKLYAYGSPGTVEFDDVVLRAVSVEGVEDEDARMLEAFDEKGAAPAGAKEGDR